MIRRQGQPASGGIRMGKRSSHRDVGAERQSMRQRMAADLDLAILVSFGATAMLVVAVFAVYRFASGNTVGGIVNCLIVTALGSVLAYVLRGGNLRRAATLFVLVTAAACVASLFAFGRTGTYWTFLVLWINFLLTRAPIAVAVNLGLVLMVALRPGQFDSPTELAAYVVTGLMVTAYAWHFSVRLARQRRQLEALASVDPLTGAGNRRVMRVELEAAINGKRDQARPAVLAVLDLDHFKRVNDAYGHEAGDRVLVAFADIVRAGLRKTDGFHRMGGEEFVVLLPGIGLDEARERLDTLHRAIDAGLAHQPGAVTVSLGVAELAPGEGWSEWLGRADAALYIAKQAGRDRIVVAGEGDARDWERRRT